MPGKELTFENGEVRDACDHDSLRDGEQCFYCDYVAPLPDPDPEMNP